MDGRAINHLTTFPVSRRHQIIHTKRRWNCASAGDGSGDCTCFMGWPPSPAEVCRRVGQVKRMIGGTCLVCRPTRNEGAPRQVIGTAKKEKKSMRDVVIVGSLSVSSPILVTHADRKRFKALYRSLRRKKSVKEINKRK